MLPVLQIFYCDVSKNESLKSLFLFQESVTIEKLVHKASHVRWMKNVARNKLYFMDIQRCK